MFPLPRSLPISLVSFSPTIPSPIFLSIDSLLPLYQCPSSFLLLFFLISFLLFSLTVTRIVFSQLWTSYYTRINYTKYHIPNIPLKWFSASPISISLRSRLVFSPFGVAYFDRGTYTNYEILNFLFLPVSLHLRFQFSLYISDIFKFPFLQNAVFTEFTANYDFFFPFNVPIASFYSFHLSSLVSVP